MPPPMLRDKLWKSVKASLLVAGATTGREGQLPGVSLRGSEGKAPLLEILFISLGGGAQPPKNSRIGFAFQVY